VTLIFIITLALAAEGQSGNSPSGGTVKFAAESAQHWTEQLTAADFRDRWHAAYMLGTLGADSAAAVPQLHKILEKKSEHEYVRGMAAWALGRVGSAAESEIPLLSETMHSRGHLAVRRASVESLGNFGEAAKSVVPQLVKLLDDDDAATRVNTAIALWKIDRHAKAVPALVEMLKSGDSPEPYLAATALGQMQSAAAAVAPALIDALHSTDGDIRRAAARSLGQLGKAAFPALAQAKALQDPDPEARRLVIESLGGMGADAVSPLIASLKDKEPSIRRAAARALGNLGSDARSALPALEAAVSDPDETVRDAGFKARKRIRGE
jgi:HEAT repeat protein